MDPVFLYIETLYRAAPTMAKAIQLCDSFCDTVKSPYSLNTQEKWLLPKATSLKIAIDMFRKMVDAAETAGKDKSPFNTFADIADNLGKGTISTGLEMMVDFDPKLKFDKQKKYNKGLHTSFAKTWEPNRIKLKVAGFEIDGLKV